MYYKTKSRPRVQLSNLEVSQPFVLFWIERYLGFHKDRLEASLHREHEEGTIDLSSNLDRYNEIKGDLERYQFHMNTVYVTYNTSCGDLVCLQCFLGQNTVV
jgi:hypothetical protein